jgi:nucleotide-binding universal stress UspA family protein
MFKRILVAYDESPESGRALLTGIHLAKSLNAELRAVSVQENLPAYVGYVDAEVPGGTALLRDQASEYYRKLQADAKEAARQAGITLTTELVEGNEVEAVLEYVVKTHSDLLIVGIHRHSSLLSGLWNHTAHDLSQRVASDIMGVH